MVTLVELNERKQRTTTTNVSKWREGGASEVVGRKRKERTKKPK